MDSEVVAQDDACEDEADFVRGHRSTWTAFGREQTWIWLVNVQTYREGEREREGEVKVGGGGGKGARAMRSLLTIGKIIVAGRGANGEIDRERRRKKRKKK